MTLDIESTSWSDCMVLSNCGGATNEIEIACACGCFCGLKLMSVSKGGQATLLVWMNESSPDEISYVGNDLLIGEMFCVAWLLICWVVFCSIYVEFEKNIEKLEKTSSKLKKSMNIRFKLCKLTANGLRVMLHFFWCSFNEVFCMNFFKQVVHANGFSPVCRRVCTCRVYLIRVV